MCKQYDFLQDKKKKKDFELRKSTVKPISIAWEKEDPEPQIIRRIPACPKHYCYFLSDIEFWQMVQKKIVEHNLVISSKVKHALTMPSSCCVP